MPATSKARNTNSLDIVGPLPDDGCCSSRRMLPSSIIYMNWCLRTACWDTVMTISLQSTFISLQLATGIWTYTTMEWDAPKSCAVQHHSLTQDADKDWRRYQLLTHTCILSKERDSLVCYYIYAHQRVHIKCVVHEMFDWWVADRSAVLWSNLDPKNLRRKPLLACCRTNHC